MSVITTAIACIMSKKKTIIFFILSEFPLKNYTVNASVPTSVDFAEFSSAHLLSCVLCQKFFRRKSARDLLPAKPVEISVEPWWVAQTGFITEDDIRVRHTLCLSYLIVNLCFQRMLVIADWLHM